MRLERLTLDNFRSYKKRIFNLGQLSLVVAPNARGKTNLLEAISLLSMGDSERAGVSEEMISFGAEIGSVTGIVEHKDERSELSVVLTRGTYMGKATPKKRFLVDQVARNKANFVGKLVVTLFCPEDMRLIEGSPARRRNFLNQTLSLAHPEYGRAVTVYEASLRRRNRVLDAIREGRAKREQLAYWDQSIIKNGNIITDYRRDFLEYLGQVKTSFGKYQMEYESSTISAARLAQYSAEEVAAGYTLVGPHKDDFRILSVQKFTNAEMQKSGKDLMKYGSRGEQRLGVLFLKIGGMRYVEEKLQVTSILLLDDIFSELDKVHRQEVIKMLSARQTIITTAEEDLGVEIDGATRVSLE